MVEVIVISDHEEEGGHQAAGASGGAPAGGASPGAAARALPVAVGGVAVRAAPADSEDDDVIFLGEKRVAVRAATHTSSPCVTWSASSPA